MPELPDVEQFRRYFDNTSLNRTIKAVRVRDPRVLRHCTSRSLGRALRGRRFVSSSRRGKYLIVNTDGIHHLILHFGMTGSLHFSPTPSPNPPRALVTFHFGEGSSLFYISQRLLGHVRLTTQPQKQKEIARLGPEPLDAAFSLARFTNRVRIRRGAIKAVLLNQTFVAGIGNLYADETLFQARIHPLEKTSALTDPKTRSLYLAMRRVLRLAIARNADSRRFPRRYLLPHRSAGNPCPRCKSPLASLRVAGRTAIFCPRCQPLLHHQ